VLVALLPFGGVTAPSGGATVPSGGGLASDTLATAAAALLDVAFTVGYFVLVERVVTGFRALQPRFCSIYQPAFWEHERFWKVPSVAYIQMFNGTPFKSVVWRLLGVRVGRRVLDDGCSIVERTLVRIGRECTLNAGSILQSHSLEDGTFKSDHIAIGDRCTIGTGAFVHYGVTMDDDAVLDADSFLMKGEHVPPGSRWRGNPAADARAARAPSGAPADHPAAAQVPAPAEAAAKAKARVPVDRLWAAVFTEDPAPPVGSPAEPCSPAPSRGQEPAVLPANRM
jgi:carbonic anhydrase/acetyltransferase-like protein (isoleucine patch superfamily)